MQPLTEKQRDYLINLIISDQDSIEDSFKEQDIRDKEDIEQCKIDLILGNQIINLLTKI